MLQTLTAKKPVLQLRAGILSGIRRFFEDRGYLEIETPVMIPAPAPEPHISTFRAGDLFLHPSPELCMKRLLASGYDRIFQICHCFRKGERGMGHLPEFTLLEWYRTGVDYLELMEECEELLPYLSSFQGSGQRIHYQGMEVRLEGPWDRVSVHEAFERYGGLSPEKAIETGLFDEIMVTKIEPRLGIRKPAFLYDYPAPLGSLARLKKNAPGLAERFELYIGGVELANGFTELTDAREQRERFERDRELRQQAGMPPCPLPEKFLDALPRMPPSAGIALGVDRLVMILSDKKAIDDVVAFTPEIL